MSGGNGSDGSSRDARSSYSNSIDSKDSSKHLANDALFGSFYKSYRNTGVVADSVIDTFLIDQIHVGSTNVDAISENLGSIDIPQIRKQHAAASFDSIYSPYSTYFSLESGLPHFEVPTNKTEPNSLTLNPQPVRTIGDRKPTARIFSTSTVNLSPEALLFKNSSSKDKS